MSGGSQTVDPTAEEISLAEIANERWSQYEETGIPTENEYIRRTTGRTFNEQAEYEIDPNGRVNADGTTKIDTSDAELANQDAFGQALNQANPNRQSVIDGVGRDSAKAGAQSATQMGLSQQTNTMKGIVNAAGMGQEREAEVLESATDMASAAQNNAANSAQRSFDRRGANLNAVGQVVGAGVTYASTKSKLDEATEK